MKETTQKLEIRDFISIGIFGAIALFLFFVTGFAASLTLAGTIANIPIVLFFESIAFMLAAIKVPKRGVFLIMGTITVLPGLMAANIYGVVLSIIGWFIADYIAAQKKFGSKSIIGAYTIGGTLQSALFTFPMYISHGDYLMQRQELLHLTDEALQQYLNVFGSWYMYGAMVALTVITAFTGAVISMKILKKHFG